MNRWLCGYSDIGLCPGLVVTPEEGIGRQAAEPHVCPPPKETPSMDMANATYRYDGLDAEQAG